MGIFMFLLMQVVLYINQKWQELFQRLSWTWTWNKAAKTVVLRAWKEGTWLLKVWEAIFSTHPRGFKQPQHMGEHFCNLEFVHLNRTRLSCIPGRKDTLLRMPKCLNFEPRRQMVWEMRQGGHFFAENDDRWTEVVVYDAGYQPSTM